MSDQKERTTRPRIVVSRCLGFQACRYNGEIIPDHFLDTLVHHVDCLTVCPEVEIGLGIPRDPVRLVSVGKDKHSIQLVQPSSERDLTDSMSTFASRFLATLETIDGFVLKGRSPSCAVKDARYYASTDTGPAFARGPGSFGQAVLERFPDLAVEDEGRLKNRHLREHFLTRIFTSARFRHVAAKPSASNLIRFHRTHKYLLLAYNQTKMRELGRLVANQKRRKIPEVIKEYGKGLSQALSRAPRTQSNINVLMHAFGYVSKQLSQAEKSFFLDTLEKYRASQLPLSSATTVLKSSLLRFDTQYVLEQTYFSPFPEELVALSDSGKSRNIH